MLDILDKPNLLHAAAVHLPIALSVLGVPCVFLAVVLSAERVVMRRLAFVCYLALLATAAGVAQTGEMARELVPPDIDTTASSLLDTHEQMAEAIWIFAGVTAVFLGISLLKFKFLRVPWVYRSTMGLAMIGSLATAGWVAFASHYGGILVYEHGIGTRHTRQVFTAPPVTTEQPDSPGSESASAGTVSDPVDEDTPEEEAEETLLPIRPIDMADARAVSFVRDIQPIIESKCLECHEGFDAEGEYWMESVELMLEAGKKAGPGVIPGEPDESAVIKYIRGEFKPRMPKGEPPLTEDELHLFRMWIAAGAIDDSDVAAAASQEPEPAAPDTAPIEEPEGDEPLSFIEDPAPDEGDNGDTQPEAGSEPAMEQDTPEKPESGTEIPPAPDTPMNGTPSSAPEETAPEVNDFAEPEPKEDAAPKPREADPAPESDVSENPDEPAPAAEAPPDEPGTEPQAKAPPKSSTDDALSISLEEVPNPATERAEGDSPVNKPELGAILEVPEKSESPNTDIEKPAPKSPNKDGAIKKTVPKPREVKIDPGDKVA